MQWRTTQAGLMLSYFLAAIIWLYQQQQQKNVIAMSIVIKMKVQNQQLKTIWDDNVNRYKNTNLKIMLTHPPNLP